VGIVSFGSSYQCAATGTIDIFTRFSSFLDWLANDFGYDGVEKLPVYV
jgi:secreted trypsin-like serine protease